MCDQRVRPQWAGDPLRESPVPGPDFPRKRAALYGWTAPFPGGGTGAQPSGTDSVGCEHYGYVSGEQHGIFCHGVSGWGRPAADCEGIPAADGIRLDHADYSPGSAFHGCDSYEDKNYSSGYQPGKYLYYQGWASKAD